MHVSTRPLSETMALLNLKYMYYKYVTPCEYNFTNQSNQS